MHGRIILHYAGPPVVRYCIQCVDVPPPVGGGLGILEIHNVARVHEEPEAPAEPYDCLTIPKLEGDEDPMPPDDVYIELAEDPEVPGFIKIPYNGGPPGVLSIKLKEFP